MFENMQQRCDVLLDACVEELFDDLITAQFQDDRRAGRSSKSGRRSD